MRKVLAGALLLLAGASLLPGSLLAQGFGGSVAVAGDEVLVAFFDAVPGADFPAMNGSWSNYPFFASGVVIVTSGSQGLFLVKHRARTPVS